MPASLSAKIPAATASWKLLSIERTHLAGKPNSFSKSNAPPLAANLIACEADVKRSKRWFPSGDLITNSTCLSICFCWVSDETGSIILRPDKISSKMPSRKILSQLPGPPAAIPLMTTDLCPPADLSEEAEDSSWAEPVGVTVKQAGISPRLFSTGVAFPVTQPTNAGL